MTLELKLKLAGLIGTLAIAAMGSAVAWGVLISKAESMDQRLTRIEKWIDEGDNRSSLTAAERKDQRP